MGDLHHDKQFSTLFNNFPKDKYQTVLQTSRHNTLTDIIEVVGFLYQIQKQLCKGFLAREQLDSLVDSLFFIEDHILLLDRVLLEEVFLLTRKIYLVLLTDYVELSWLIKYLRKLQRHLVVLFKCDRKRFFQPFIEAKRRGTNILVYRLLKFFKLKIFSRSELLSIFKLLDRAICILADRSIIQVNRINIINTIMRNIQKSFYKQKWPKKHYSAFVPNSNNSYKKLKYSTVSLSQDTNYYQTGYQQRDKSNYEQDSLYNKVKHKSNKKHKKIKNNKKQSPTESPTGNSNKYDVVESPIASHHIIPIYNYIAASLMYDNLDPITRHYYQLKITELQDPITICKNMFKFEKKILMPLYHKITSNTDKQRPYYQSVFDKYKKCITAVVQSLTQVPFRVEPFGSFSNTFLLEEGDIDICIIPDQVDFLKGFDVILEKIQDELVIKGIATSLALIQNSRFLLLKVIDIESKFSIDITVHSLLPILNTNLIRAYSVMDKRFHIMGIYLKYWAKLNNVQGTTNCYLSSYALLLMLIFFLQNIIHPHVLPNLQSLKEDSKPYTYKQMDKVYQIESGFLENPVKANEHLFKINSEKINFDSVTSLLVRFFEFYAYYFDSEVMRISIHRDLEHCIKKGDRFAFSMEDPFDPNHNPGRSMHMNSFTHQDFVREMKREINFIMSGEYLKRLEGLSEKASN